MVKQFRDSKACVAFVSVSADSYSCFLFHSAPPHQQPNSVWSSGNADCVIVAQTLAVISMSLEATDHTVKSTEFGFLLYGQYS